MWALQKIQWYLRAGWMDHQKNLKKIIFKLKFNLIALNYHQIHFVAENLTKHANCMHSERWLNKII